jgi:hypothetical protein
LANRINFFIRDDSGVAATCYQHLNPRRGYDVEPALQSTAEKNVTGKKRQQELLASVLPPVCGGVEWKKDLESLVRQSMCDGFLMLMACVKHMPIEFLSRAADLFTWPKWHKAPPCDLHETSRYAFFSQSEKVI